MKLLTSHLESTAEYSVERKKQLKIGFDAMQNTPVNCTVVFGGDLNLRDKEVSDIFTIVIYSLFSDHNSRMKMCFDIIL